jgi:hypothetical protein
MEIELNDFPTWVWGLIALDYCELSHMSQRWKVESLFGYFKLHISSIK